MVQCMFLAFRNLKISSNKVNTGHKAKSKLPMMFFDVKKLQDKCGSWQLQVHLQKTRDITYLGGDIEQGSRFITY